MSETDHSEFCCLIYATQNGWKLPILFEEMGFPYDWALVDFMKNEQLRDSGGPFVLGRRCTLVDIACFTYCASFYWANVDISEVPRLRAWIDMLHERPSFRTGLTIPFARPAFFGPPHATQAEIEVEIARNAGQFEVVTKAPAGG